MSWAASLHGTCVPDARCLIAVPAAGFSGLEKLVMRTIAIFAAASAVSVSAFAFDVYKVTVTRKDQDLYSVQEQPGVCIKTQFCLHLALGDQSILRLDSQGPGFNIGKLIFSDGSDCQVNGVVRL